MPYEIRKTAVTVGLFLILSFVSVVVPEVKVVEAESNTIVVPEDYFTIQEAVDNAAEGDTVFVRKGYYFESVLINKSLSLIGEAAESTIIRGDYRLNGTIVLVRHDNVNVTGFTIQAPSRTWSRRGIHLLHVRYCNVSGNTITDCGCGIWLYGASQNSIIGNNLTDSTYGIRIDFSDGNMLVNNVAADCAYGIQLTSSTNNTFRNNKMANNSHSFEFSDSEGPTFFNDVDASNTIDEKPICYWVNRSDETVPSDVEYIILVNCTGITVQDVDAVKNYKEILLAYTNNSNIRNTNAPLRLVSSVHNTIAHNTGTVQLENSSSNTITENIIKYTSKMIHLTGSSGNIISGNTITNGYGIIIDQSSNDNIISNNTLTNNHQGIHLSGSSHNILRNNLMIDNEDQFFVSSSDSALTNFVHYVDTSNIVNGKPVYYWINKRDTTIPSDAGYAVLVNCTNISVENLNFTDGQSILLAWTTNSTITKNTIKNGQGIHLVHSSNNNTVSENTLTNNDYGIVVSYCFDNLLVGNNITNNIFRGINLRECQSISVIGNTITNNDVHGIGLMENANKNTISENHIAHNGIGIFVEDSSENLIVGNMILENDDWGMQLKEGQHSNIIYHNYFINNKKLKNGLQVSIPGLEESGGWKPGHANVWDDGERGNYWSDYLTRYPNATEIDNLGIGDTPFHINPNNIDNYPVMEVNVIPEFSSWIILPLLITATLLIMICKQRLPKNR